MTDRSETGRDDGIDFGPYLKRYLAGDARALEALPERERRLALLLAPAFELHDDAESASAALPQGPPLEQDPVAIALGLVPGPDDVLSARVLQHARKAAHLDLEELVQRLQDRAWDVTVEEVFDWHRADTQLAPALMKAIAAVLDIPFRNLRSPVIAMRSASLEGVLDDATIAAYLAEWAADTGEDPSDVRDRARRTLASASYRNRADISREEILAILRALRRIDLGGAGR